MRPSPTRLALCGAVIALLVGGCGGTGAEDDASERSTDLVTAGAEPTDGDQAATGGALAGVEFDVRRDPG